jgi:hypothetical protein
MALNGCEDAYLWTRNPRKTGIFQGLFPVATLLWSWVSGVRIPSLTPLKPQVRSPDRDHGPGLCRDGVRFWEQNGSLWVPNTVSSHATWAYS